MSDGCSRPGLSPDLFSRLVHVHHQSARPVDLSCTCRHFHVFCFRLLLLCEKRDLIVFGGTCVSQMRRVLVGEFAILFNVRCVSAFRFLTGLLQRCEDISIASQSVDSIECLARSLVWICGSGLTIDRTSAHSMAEGSS